MFAEKFISENLPCLTPHSTPEYALEQMEKFNVRHLPVVENGQFLGLYTVKEAEGETPARGVFMKDSEGFYLLGSQHVFDAVQLVVDNNLTVAPVLNEKKEYLGCITPNEMAHCFAEVVAVEENGAFVILDVERYNYSLSQIASIVESNHGKILNVFLYQAPDSSRVYVNIKINTEDMSSIVLTFERFGYRIAHIFADYKQLRDTQDRYNALMAYINI